MNYFNKTRWRPKSKTDCSLREFVRRMDFSNESWYSNLPKEKQRHKMYQCEEYFKRKLYKDQDATTTLQNYFLKFILFMMSILFISCFINCCLDCDDLHGCCCFSCVKESTSPVNEISEGAQNTHQLRYDITSLTSETITSRTSLPYVTTPKTFQESPPAYDQALSSLPSFRDVIVRS